MIDTISIVEKVCYEMKELWYVTIDILKLINISTSVALLGLIILLSYGVGKFEEPPSVSKIIAYNRETTVSFTILVFVHGYSVIAYLIILSKYYDTSSLYFRVSCTSCVVYLFALVLLSYLPLDRHEDPHDVVAMIAFFFALFSSIIHRPGFIIKKEYKEDVEILTFEIIFLILVLIFGGLFWFNNSMVSEYFFMSLIVIDKTLKVYILERIGILKIKGSQLKYSFIVPETIVTGF